MSQPGSQPLTEIKMAPESDCRLEFDSSANCNGYDFCARGLKDERAITPRLDAGDYRCNLLNCPSGRQWKLRTRPGNMLLGMSEPLASSAPRSDGQRVLRVRSGHRGAPGGGGNERMLRSPSAAPALPATFLEYRHAKFRAPSASLARWAREQWVIAMRAVQHAYSAIGVDESSRKRHIVHISSSVGGTSS